MKLVQLLSKEEVEGNSYNKTEDDEHGQGDHDKDFVLSRAARLCSHFAFWDSLDQEDTMLHAEQRGADAVLDLVGRAGWVEGHDVEVRSQDRSGAAVDVAATQSSSSRRHAMVGSASDRECERGRF